MRTIGKLAKELGISVETVRFYERKGLIHQPEKPFNGYRQYSDEILHRIRFIKRIQELGFTLEEIIFLLELNDQPCCQVQSLTQEKLTSIQQKISDLTQLEKALKNLLIQCDSNQDKNNCPIIDALQS